MFELMTEFKPRGDQPKAIHELSNGVLQGKKSQVLLGVTASGKTFTMANIIQNVQKPTLILAHNKTLAAQLYQEFRSFFPKNAVEYFVSYYDYYQPEAYIPRTDTYIEKDLAINETIEKMRLSATRSLLERPDVIIVASISCIYGLGSPEYYKEMNLELKVGTQRARDEVLLHLVDIQYVRNDIDFHRATFRVRGDVLDIFPAYEEDFAFRIEFFGNEIERIVRFDPLTGKYLEELKHITIYPGSHFVTTQEVRGKAIDTIKAELDERLKYFESENKLLEYQRLSERTRYDLEMIREVGFCKGIENYSRHFSLRKPGDPPPCLIDYFPSDWLLFIDESHQTVPQIHGMHRGDRARKAALVDFGFRLPSAYDNRPLAFHEFYENINQVVYVSATPASYEIQEAQGVVVEQIIRPTGLIDPQIEIRPAKTQVDDCLGEIAKEVKNGGRVLVTTLTKRLAEELSTYLKDLGVKARYLHSEIDTIERLKIIHELRIGTFNVLVGINLLREGLDIPEVSLVAILDCDRPGFLRSETSLIQTCGRAARNVNGRVIMYADAMTAAMQKTIEETDRRREIQKAFNEQHGITPQTVKRSHTLFEIIEESMSSDSQSDTQKEKKSRSKKAADMWSLEEIRKKVSEWDQSMKKAAKELRFEDAATARDMMNHFKDIQMALEEESSK